MSTTPASTVTAGPVTRRSDRIAARPSSAIASAGSGSLVLSNVDGGFTWDDVLILWEIKSSATINQPSVFSNLIPKATEVLRFQWQRRRLHEGLVLKELQDVVQLLAWDAPTIEGTLSADEVYRDYQLRIVSTKSAQTTPIANRDQRSTTEIHPDSDSASTNDTDNNFDPRQYRQTVTEYIPGSFTELILSDPLRLLSAWRSLYRIVDAIAMRGWVHRDLSLNNVRFRHQHGSTGSPLSATLIDFDLAAPIIGPFSGLPDRTGTVAFMPIQILESNKWVPVRHQELHEDEAVFWIGFLAIISRSTPGRTYIENNLDDPFLSLTSLAHTKCNMFYPTHQRIDWPSWFNISSRTQGQSNTILRELCRRIFTNSDGDSYDYGYPGVTEIDELTLCRKHETQHKEVSRKIIVALGEAIDDLMKLQQGGDGGKDGDPKET
ncbi:MAG: hypothetical protein M1840_002406 [Geoglossum simile]|nr:MAG: hypothetical protein M1840_002406 [Geoglossum simile]